jgi:hypothetical protein
MNRLQTELLRLYGPQDAQAQGAAGGTVRAMVLEVAKPAGWDEVSTVWQGVQVDLELPPPAIALSGTDAYQLWFSFAQPVPHGQVLALMEALRSRYLGDAGQARITMHPPGAAQGLRLPPFEAQPGQWSAFVAADLAALFADERWLDLTPGADAQAELLSRLQSVTAHEWTQALARLAPSETASAGDAAPASGSLDPRRFLLEVMNDPAVDLRLRIEAAKALLPFFEGKRSP